MPCPRYPVAQLLGVRRALHVPRMAAFFGARMGKGLLRSRRPLRQALRAPVLVSTSFLVMFGRRHIPLAETTAIISRPPLLITALTMLSAPLLRESAEKIQWAAALGFAGVLLIIRPGASVFDPAVFAPCRA